MSNLVRMFSGRKKDSSVWRYFSYDDESDRSTCQVKTIKDDKECGVELAGKIRRISRFAPSCSALPS